MSEEILNYDLNPDESITDHDAVCIAQAGKLLQIGYLEYETAVYGTAYFQNDDIHYFISAREETMDRFLRQSYQQNITPTPVKYYFKRYDLVNDSEEAIKRRFRYEVAHRLQAAYPRVFFEALQALTAQPSPGSAYTLLLEMTEQLDSCFDLQQLQLFGQLLEMLLRGRLLTLEGYQLLSRWLDNEYEKIAVEPAASGDYRRTYSGFAYQKPNGQTAYFCDAFPYMASEKHMLFINKGYIVTPILTRTTYADSFQSLEPSREAFKKDLTFYLGGPYLRLMRLLRQLPPSVDTARYWAYQEALESAGSKPALDAFRYYGYLWNVPLRQ